MKPVTEPILCAAASAFDFGGPMVCDPHHYGEGHINDTFVVWRANHTKRFILQRINTDTFTDPAGLMENICGVTQHLRAKIQAEGGDPGRECLNVIPTLSGAAYYIDSEGNAWRAYVVRSEKFMHGVEIMEQMVPGMQEKILSGQFKVRDADMHRLAKADYIDRQKIVDEILYPERKVEPKPNTNGAAPEPGKAPYMPMLKIESVYDSDAYPKDVRYEYVALENITTRFRTEFDYQLKIMPDTAQREVILEIIHKHKEYLAFLESALAEDAQTA